MLQGRAEPTGKCVTHARNSYPPDGLVIYCRTTTVSAAHAKQCATYCTPRRSLIRAFSGWIRTLPPTKAIHKQDREGDHVGEQHRSRFTPTGEQALMRQRGMALQGYLAHQKAPSPRTLQ